MHEQEHAFWPTFRRNRHKMWGIKWQSSSQCTNASCLLSHIALEYRFLAHSYLPHVCFSTRNWFNYRHMSPVSHICFLNSFKIFFGIYFYLENIYEEKSDKVDVAMTTVFCPIITKKCLHPSLMTAAVSVVWDILKRLHVYIRKRSFYSFFILLVKLLRQNWIQSKQHQYHKRIIRQRTFSSESSKFDRE